MNRSAEDGEWSSPHDGGEGTWVPPRRTKVCAGDTVGKSVSDPGRPGIVRKTLRRHRGDPHGARRRWGIEGSRTTERAPVRLSAMIEALNPVIRGWGNYYRKANVRTLFHRLDGWIERRLLSFIA